MTNFQTSQTDQSTAPNFNTDIWLSVITQTDEIDRAKPRILPGLMASLQLVVAVHLHLELLGLHDM